MPLLYHKERAAVQTALSDLCPGVTAQRGETGLGRAGHGGAVHGNQPEVHGKAFLPLEVVHQAPVEVALHWQTVSHTVLYPGQGLLDKRYPAGVIDGGNAVLRDDQIAVEVCGNLAQHMFQGLGIEFIVHLSQFRTLRGGQLAGGAVQGAGVVLHAQEVVLLNIGQVVGELLLPRGVSKGFSARLAKFLLFNISKASVDFPVLLGPVINLICLLANSSSTSYWV